MDVTNVDNSGVPQESNKLISGQNRPLTREEADLLRWLLEHGSDGASTLMPQIERLAVIGKCTCGCPTIYFALDGVPVKRKGARIISDHLANVDGMPVGMIVFETNQHLSSLEVYSLPGTDKPFGLPSIDSILGGDSRI